MVEIDKTITKSVDVTLDIKWILATTEPTAPSGYSRYSLLDIELGALGTLFAFLKD